MAETLEDLARECAERIWSIDNSGYLDGSRIGQYSNLILSTLRKAVEQERERCASSVAVQAMASTKRQAELACPDGDTYQMAFAAGYTAASADAALSIRSLT